MTSMVLNLDQDLTDDQVKKSFEFLFDRLLDKMKLEPKQEAALKDRKEEIINQLFDSWKKTGNKLQLNDFKTNPALLNKLFVNLMVTALHEKHFDKQFMDKLILGLKDINPDFDPSKINKLEDLKEFFTEKQLKQILTPEVMKKWQDYNKEVGEKLKPLSNKPEMVQKKMEEVEKVDDAFTNLFGMICPHTASGYIPTGGLIATVTSYTGPGIFTDLNPEHGLDNIGSMNDPNDTQFGDPLSLIAEKIINYLQEDDLVTEMQNYVRVQAPKLHP